MPNDRQSFFQEKKPLATNNTLLDKIYEILGPDAEKKILFVNPYPGLCSRILFEVVKYERGGEDIEYSFSAEVTDLDAWNKNEFIKNGVITEPTNKQNNYIISATAPISKMIFLFNQPYVEGLMGGFSVRTIAPTTHGIK